MSFSHQNLQISETRNVKLAIVAPTGGMACSSTSDLAAAEIHSSSTRQGMPMFSGEELLHFLQLADFACFNDHEARLLCDRHRTSPSNNWPESSRRWP